MNKHRTALFNSILIFILIAEICIFTIFTVFQMGMFTKEPEMEIEAKYTGRNAPVLRIATDYDFCPNSYYDSNHELTGLYIEIMTEVANRLKMKPEFIVDDWPGSRENLTEGKADVLVGLEIFSNMEGTLRTIPISSDELCTYGKEKLFSVAGLSGKKVAVMVRSVLISTFDLHCEYQEYYTNTEILEAVENGEVDYGICHAAVSKKIIESNGFQLKKGTAVMKSFPALAVSDSRPDLQEKLNKTVQELAEEGVLYNLKTKWITDYTKDRSFRTVIRENRAFYLVLFMSGAILMILTVFFWIYVNRKTAYIESMMDYQQQLKASKQEEERANRAKSEFLSHMSHDIRTPLNGILGMVKLIRMNPEDPANVENCLRKIDLASGHLFSLINDVLDMSRLGGREVKPDMVLFSLKEELEYVRAIMDGKINEKKMKFVMDATHISHHWMIGCTGYLTRILLNLLSNAWKYTPENGNIKMDIVETSEDGERAWLSFRIQDNGAGMSREFVEHSLYKPFTQENDNIRTNYQGTGLGMAIVHEMTDAMGGTIQVESELGKGTVFTVFLPFGIGREPEKELETEAKQKEGRPDISGMRILLAEDNELNREIAAMILEEAGVLVVSAENGREAADIFAQSEVGSFDAILMDIMMPVLDGLQAAEEIRRMKRADAAVVPIFAVTANAFEEDRKKTAAVGMNGHLTKPLDIELLFEILARCRNGANY